MKNIDRNLSSIDQFYAVKSFDWSGERVQVDLFCELLKTIKSDVPSMIELGSAGVGGSFYSVLFEKWFDKKCMIINVDPRKEMLEEVKTYWKDLHLTQAKFYHGYVGVPKHYQALPDFKTDQTPFLKINNMFEENKITKLDILHADIQGSEISVCEEMKSDGLLDRVRYFFISTHSGEGINTYHPCMDIFSSSLNCKFHFSDPLNGGWGDGLIVVENLSWE